FARPARGRVGCGANGVSTPQSHPCPTLRTPSDSERGKFCLVPPEERRQEAQREARRRRSVIQRALCDPLPDGGDVVCRRALRPVEGWSWTARRVLNAGDARSALDLLEEVAVVRVAGLDPQEPWDFRRLHLYRRTERLPRAQVHPLHGDGTQVATRD